MFIVKVYVFAHKILIVLIIKQKQNVIQLIKYVFNAYKMLIAQDKLVYVIVQKYVYNALMELIVLVKQLIKFAN